MQEGSSLIVSSSFIILWISAENIINVTEYVIIMHIYYLLNSLMYFFHSLHCNISQFVCDRVYLFFFLYTCLSVCLSVSFFILDINVLLSNGFGAGLFIVFLYKFCFQSSK